MIVSLELLGNSQTFLGTLATLILLFIFVNKSDNTNNTNFSSDPSETNLIKVLLYEIITKIEEQIKTMNSEISLDSIFISNEYKRLKNYIDNCSEDNNPFVEDALSLSIEITTKKMFLQTQYIDVEGNNTDYLSEIVNAKETLLSPFYTLLFVLSIFAFDELLRVVDYNKVDFVLSWLGCFIAYSYIFWLILWVKYLLKFQRFGSEPRHNEYGDFVLFKLFRSMSFTKKIISVFLVFSIYLLIFSFFFSHFKTSPYLVVFVLFILPYFLFGFFMAFIKNDKKDYSFTSVTRHYLINIIFPFFLSIILIKITMYYQTTQYMMIIEQDFIRIKFWIIFFTLLNGILFPYLFPYITIKRYYSYVEKIKSEGKSNANSLIEELWDKLLQFNHKCNMRTITIERSAIHALEVYIDNCPILESNISKTEKNPFWDGYLYVYKDGNKGNKKDNFHGKVPVRVNGKFDNNIEIQISRAEAEVYMKDGGCLILKVEVKEDLSTTILYAILSGTVIKGHLQQGDGYIKYQLDAIPNNPLDFQQIVYDFVTSKNKERIENLFPKKKNNSVNGFEKFFRCLGCFFADILIWLKIKDPTPKEIKDLVKGFEEIRECLGEIEDDNAKNELESSLDSIKKLKFNGSIGWRDKFIYYSRKSLDLAAKNINRHDFANLQSKLNEYLQRR